MREVTFLKEAYRRYKDRGVDIVSVSLDTDGDRWRSAIVDWEMPWKHVSDLQGWKTAPVVKLGIEGIPFIVVVDSEGYVVNPTNKLFDEIAPRYAGRTGGYTRIIRLGARRGDGSEMAILEFV